MWVQYTIVDRHGVINKGSLWVLNFQPHRFQGVQLYQFFSQTTVLCVIGQIVGGVGVTGRAYLGLFLFWYIILPQFQGTCGVRSAHIQHRIIIECLYLLFCVIL